MKDEFDELRFAYDESMLEAESLPEGERIQQKCAVRSTDTQEPVEVNVIKESSDEQQNTSDKKDTQDEFESTQDEAEGNGSEHVNMEKVQLQILSSQVEDLEQELDQVRKLVDASNSQNQICQQKLLDKAGEIEKLEAEVKDLQQELDWSERHSKDLQDSLEDCWGGKGALTEDLAKLKTEHEHLKEEKECVMIME